MLVRNVKVTVVHDLNGVMVCFAANRPKHDFFVTPLQTKIVCFINTRGSVVNLSVYYKLLEGFVSPQIFIQFFINSDSDLTQAQMFALKLFPN